MSLTYLYTGLDERIPPASAIPFNEDGPRLRQVPWETVTSLWLDDGGMVQVAPAEEQFWSIPRPMREAPQSMVIYLYVQDEHPTAPPSEFEECYWINPAAIRLHANLWPTPPVTAVTYDDLKLTLGTIKFDEGVWDNPAMHSIRNANWPTPPARIAGAFLGLISGDASLPNPAIPLGPPATPADSPVLDHRGPWWRKRTI